MVCNQHLHLIIRCLRLARSAREKNTASYGCRSSLFKKTSLIHGKSLPLRDDTRKPLSASDLDAHLTVMAHVLFAPESGHQITVRPWCSGIGYGGVKIN